MRFLLDQPISQKVGKALQAAGHEAVHAGELRLAAASDKVILERAVKDGCVIVTQDTDFGTLLSGSGQRLPSVILLRMRDGRPSVQAQAASAEYPGSRGGIAGRCHCGCDRRFHPGSVFTHLIAPGGFQPSAKESQQ